jgi:lipoic acid synthetase
VVRYVPPAEFEALAADGRALGFRHVEAGPLVRSSYHAKRQVEAAGAAPSAD